MLQNVRLSEVCDVVLGLAPVVPSTSTPDYIKMRNFTRCEVLILVKNATTVTGSAITLKQATSAAGGSEKALAFTTMLSNIDLAASDVMARTAVTSNTFTTDATNSKNLLYRVDVKAEDLDHANGFTWLRAGTGDATAATVTVLYLMYGARNAKDIHATQIA